MGGSGSGNWYRWDKKTTVEESRHLDANRWMREGILVPNHWQRGGWTWRDSYTGEQTASIGYEVDTNERSGWARLFYTITSYRGEQTAYDYTVPLVTTQPHFGGLRWWFRCSLSVNGRPCYRRVGKLYLPSGGCYYGCRHCYDLTYKSSQESDKRVSRLARDPWALYQALTNATDAAGDDTQRSVPDLLLALKAMQKRKEDFWDL